MSPYRAQEPFDWPVLLELIRAAFAGMAGRIDPPSSMHGLTAADIARQAVAGEVWVAGDPPVACLFLSPEPGALYLHRLAVAPHARRQGHARRLIDAAEDRARAHGLAVLRLQTRVELAENHATFRALGFAQTAASAHPGYTRPTSLTFERPVTGAG
jgi:ribosomal protein S18 acetylase RimI-like enzyme